MQEIVKDVHTFEEKVPGSDDVIMYHIIEKTNGKFSVHSNKNKGTEMMKLSLKEAKAIYEKFKSQQHG